MGMCWEQQIIKFAWSTGCDQGSNEKERKENVGVECIDSKKKTRIETAGLGSH